VIPTVTNPEMIPKFTKNVFVRTPLRAVVIIREIGIISGLVTVGITDVVSTSGLPRYQRDTQAIPIRFHSFDVSAHVTVLMPSRSTYGHTVLQYDSNILRIGTG
jgi:hypothetical protein